MARSRYVIIVVLLALVGAGYARSDRRQTSNPKYAHWLAPSRLRGANVAIGPRPNQWPAPEVFVSLRAAGANLVELSADGIQKQTAPYPYDSVPANRLFKAIRDAEVAGLHVVVSMRTGPGLTDIAIEAQEPGLQSRLWIDPVARHAYGEMWERIARHLANDSMVIGYDLIVEPLPEAAVPGLSVWSAAISDTAVRHRGIDWTAYADTLIMDIRKVDSLTPVLVGATGFTAPPYFATMRPVHDRYVVYDVHQYEPQNYTMQGTSKSYPTGMRWPSGRFQYWRDRTYHNFDPRFLASALAPVRHFQERAGNPPVFVGEFGINRQAPGAAEFIRAQSAVFDSLGWQSAMWIWGCCGYMQVEAADSASPDSGLRAIYAAYRAYWAEARP